MLGISESLQGEGANLSNSAVEHAGGKWVTQEGYLRIDGNLEE